MLFYTAMGMRKKFNLKSISTKKNCRFFTQQWEGEKKKSRPGSRVQWQTSFASQLCRLESIPGGFSGSIWCTSDDWWKLKGKQLFFSKENLFSISPLNTEFHAFPDKRRRLCFKSFKHRTYSRGTTFHWHSVNDEQNSHLQTKSLHGHFLEILKFYLSVLLLTFISPKAHRNPAFAYKKNLPLFVKIAAHDCKKLLASRQIFQKFQKRI